jgi:formate--tetrahydrofolate ligase
MPNDLAIARDAILAPIEAVAKSIGLNCDDLELYGKYKAKISFSCLNRTGSPGETSRGKLVLVTAITPTRAGEGKTTVAIGLAQALWRAGRKSIAVIREPSLGPVFGMKGGATGGGHAQVAPMEDINLHFTGDMHAISSANNLLCTMIDNHIYHGNEAGIDSRTISQERAVDMNDRALRAIVQGLGGKANGYPRESGFNITAASEVMAILCLSDSFADLQARLARIVIGRGKNGDPITAGDLKAAGAMSVLLRDAIKPNLVQTLECTPAFVHGGPFANIAHGCSSVMSIKLALSLGEIVVTEGGFGSDLGFEKYCDILAAPRLPLLAPDAVVLVVTIRALKLHGGVSFEELEHENIPAVEAGLANLDRHAAIVKQVGVPVVVTVNRFEQDKDAEIDVVARHCKLSGLTMVVNDVWGQGGIGGLALAESVISALKEPGEFKPIYPGELSVIDKLNLLAEKVYGADCVELEPDARQEIKWLTNHGFANLPVCVAKTQYSFSDEPYRLGAPRNFKMRVRNFRLSAGAGFVVALMGEIMTMPGLPKIPAAEHMSAGEEGEILNIS